MTLRRLMFVCIWLVTTAFAGFGQGIDTWVPASPEDEEYADNHFKRLSTQTQAVAFFDYQQTPDGFDTLPDHQKEKLDGWMDFVLTPAGRLVFRVTMRDGRDNEVPDQYMTAAIAGNWFYFGTEGRMYEDINRNPVTNLVPYIGPDNKRIHERYQGKPVDDIGNIKMIAAKGNRIFAVTEEGILYMASIASTTTSGVIRNDPHGMTPWTERKAYEEDILDTPSFELFGLAVTLEGALGLVLERPFLWYQLEMPKLQYKDDAGRQIADEIIDIAVAEIFKKTKYDRRYNADYHNPFSGLMRGDADNQGMLKYSDFFDGIVTYYIFVKRIINGDTAHPQFVVRWTDEHTYTMIGHPSSGAWRDLDLTQGGWPKVGHFKVDPKSPTVQEIDLWGLALEQMFKDKGEDGLWTGDFYTKLTYFITGASLSQICSGTRINMIRFGYPFGKALQKKFSTLSAYYFLKSFVWLPWPRGFRMLRWALTDFCLANGQLLERIDNVNIGAQWKFYRPRWRSAHGWYWSEEKFHKFYKEPYCDDGRLQVNWPAGELEPYDWDETKWWDPYSGGLLNENSRIDATHEHLIISTDSGKIYSIAFNYGGMDFTWRSRDITPLPATGQTLEDIGYDPENIRFRSDMFIYVKGEKDGIPGYYYQSYLDPAQGYGYLWNPYGLPPPTGGEVAFAHGRKWYFVPDTEYTQNFNIQSYNVAFNLSNLGNNTLSFVLTNYPGIFEGHDTSLMEVLQEKLEVTKKPIDYAIATNEIKVLPLEILYHHPYLDLAFSINGADFIQAQHISTHPDLTTLEEAQAFYEVNEADIPVLFYDDMGEGLLVSPRFKEGCNTIVFRFTELSGQKFYRDLSLMQLTVPPFIKPIYPLMNQYVNEADMDVVIQAQDILGPNTSIKPEDWFPTADITITVDGQVISDYVLEPSDNTIRFALYNLADGNHTVQMAVDYLGLPNAAGWRFWVDTTAPVVSFPENIILRSADENEYQNISYYVRDTIPFISAGETYPVDTVYLASVNAAITNGTTVLQELQEKTTCSLGLYSKEWNGCTGNSPLTHGVYQLTVNAVDRVGNQSVSSKEVIIDNQAPVLASVSLNHQLINLESGALELHYKLALDPWEESGDLYIRAENVDTGEAYTFNTEDAGLEDGVLVMDYFSSGEGLFQDGRYALSVYTGDRTGNRSEPVSLPHVVVDLNAPRITDASAMPFVLTSQHASVELGFTVDEEKDAAVNYSDVLHLGIILLDQHGEVVQQLSDENIIPGTAYKKSYDVYAGLADGKYFFGITVTDKNGNAKTETAAFIREAMPPEILVPEQNALISGIVTLYGNVTDPKWDNDAPFSHYELYYRSGVHSLPADLSDFDEWQSTYLTVPLFQQKNELHPNFGYYPVEGNNVLASFDTTALAEGAVTLLLIAEETGGYKIGTTVTCNVLNDESQHQITVNIDPPFDAAAYAVDFTNTDTLGITYSVDHAVDNPVDIYSSIKDAAGRIVKQSSAYNLKSGTIQGVPSLVPEDSGVFVYQNEAGKFSVRVFNVPPEAAEYNVMIKTSGEFIQFFDENGNDIEPPDGLIDGNTIVFNNAVEELSSFFIRFELSENSPLSIIAIKDEAYTPVFLGANKTPSASGNITLYGSSVYPPVNWDGKNEWGGFVQNGTYTIGVEAYGKLGGYGQDTCILTVNTPFVLSAVEVSNHEIQPPIPGLDFVSVQFSVNKACAINVRAYDASATMMRNIIPQPATVSEPGNVQFSWYADNELGQIVQDGTYHFRIECTLENGSVFQTDVNSYPVLGGVIVDSTPQNINPAITAELDKLAEEQYQGRDVIRGNTSYTANIKPKGQYLPQQTATMEVTGRGTQQVDAYPDLNYMAAFRTIYKELWTELVFSRLDFVALYEVRKRPDKTVPYSLYFNNSLIKQKVASLDLSIEKIEDQFQTFTVNFTKKITFDLRMYKDYHNVYLLRDAELYKLVSPKITLVPVQGRNYMGTPEISASISCDVTDRRDYDYKRNPKGSTFVYKITVAFSGQCKVRPDFTVKDYLAVAEGVAFMGPDISPETDYAHRTGFVNKGRDPVNYPLIYDDPAGLSTGMKVPHTEEVWRKEPEYYFYYKGENYDNVDLNGWTVTDDTVMDVFNVTPVKIPENFTSETYQDGQVLFTLNRNPDGLTYNVAVVSEAHDKLLIEYPADPADFDMEREIGNAALGIPNIKINGQRSNASDLAAQWPNFVIPRLKEGTEEKNVIFSSDVIPWSLTSALFYHFDEEDLSKSGYSGSFDLSSLKGEYGSVPEGVDVKFWEISNVSADGIVFGGLVGTTVPLDGPQSIVEIDDTHILSIDNVVWTLSHDNRVAGDVMSLQGPLTQTELEELNRTGALGRMRIADPAVYPFSPTPDVSERNMYHTNVETNKVDNGDVVIVPGSRNYTGNGEVSEYGITVESIDGQAHAGLELKNTVYLGKGKKLFDTFTLGTAEQSPRQLVPICGRGEGTCFLSYLVNGRWKEIPIYNAAPQLHILTYWDVKGLNGLYTLRLMSRVGNEYNAAFKEVYVGSIINTNGNEAVLVSASGQAKIIFPQGSVTTGLVANIDCYDLEEVPDIATLPDIAPLGKVIALTPEGTEFTGPLPQLQFTYHKSQIDELGIDPRQLVIYHLTPGGVLEPINTIKQLIKVTDNGEQILWESTTSLPGEMPLDYTYIKAWGVLSHFSYYLALEGMVNEMPQIAGGPLVSGTPTMTINGKGVPGSSVNLLTRNTQYFDISTDEYSGVLNTQVDEQGNFAFQDVYLPLENRNYFYLWYDIPNNTAVKKLIVIKDTQAPLVQMPNDFATSHPAKATAFMQLRTSENCTVHVNITSKDSGAVVSLHQANVAGNRYVIIPLPLVDMDNNPLSDGLYGIAMTATDAVGNTTTVSNYNLLVQRDITPSKVIVYKSRLVTIKFSDSVGQGIPGGAVYYYDGDKGAHMPVGLTNSAGEVVCDLYGHTYSFKLDYRGKSSYTTQNIQNSPVVLFATQPAKIRLAYTDGNGIQGKTVSFHDSLIREYQQLGLTDGNGEVSTEMLAGEYVFAVDNNQTVLYKKQDIAEDPVVVFLIDNTPAELQLHMGEHQLYIVPNPVVVKFTINETALVHARIVDGSGNEMYTMQKLYYDGFNSFVWEIVETQPLGEYKLEIFTIDMVGNVSAVIERSFELVIDITPPEVSFETMIIVEEATGILTPLVLAQPTITDDSPPVTITCDAPEAFPIESTLVTWRVADRFGNTATVTQEVIIVDTTPPVFTHLPADITIEATGPLTPINIGQAEATDIFPVHITHNAPEAFPIGTTIVTWTAMDENENQAIHEQKITITDTTPPVTQLRHVGILGENGYHISPLQITLNASDIASGVQLIRYSINNSNWLTYAESFMLAEQETYSVHWQSQDNEGNWEEPNHIVFNIDLENPHVSAEQISQPGLTVVYLKATDNFSGLDRIEYNIDGYSVHKYEFPVSIMSAGEHVVLYRSVDRAGRTSGWQEYPVHTPEFDKGIWIKDLRFAYHSPGRSVVRNVDVGERMYSLDFGRWNKIKNLPDYLVGADYIRMRTIDKFYWGKVFAKFTAGADIDVYIMKHPQSRADLSGWQLIEEKYPVQPMKYFPRGVSIYRKTFYQGERVAIPGSCVHGFGSGNLVFVQYRLSNYIKITSPAGGRDIVPLDRIQYDAVILKEKGLKLRWYVKLGHETAWNLLGEDRGYFDIPYIEDKQNIQFKVELLSVQGEALIEKIVTYAVVNKFAVKMLSPGPGTEIKRGEEIPIKYAVFGLNGEEMTREVVSWRYKLNEKEWQQLPKSTTPIIPSQGDTGELLVEGTYQVNETIKETVRYILHIVDEYDCVPFFFGKESDKSEWTTGQITSMSESGKYYGFNIYHGAQAGSFFLKNFHGKKWRWWRPIVKDITYIRLLPGGSFEYNCGQGLYRVKIVLGPLLDKEQMNVTLEGKLHACTREKGKPPVVEIEEEVDIRDGMFTVSGTEGLPIIYLELERL